MMKLIATYQQTLVVRIVPRFSARIGLGPLFAVGYLVCLGWLHAQQPASLSTASDTPIVQSAADALPTSAVDTELTETPRIEAPTVPNFDIDLDTEEFENFGEEDFEVDDKLSKTGEATVFAVKVAGAIVVVLLIAFVGWKLIKQRRNI